MKIAVVGSIVGLMIFVGITSAEPLVLDQATFGGHTYYLVGERNPDNNFAGAGISWSDAQAFAQTLGGNLVTIDSQAKNDFLLQTWGEAAWGGYPPVSHLWIGLSDDGDEGNFSWQSGSPLGYTNWAPGEPNNDASAGGENYAAIIASLSDPDRGRWNDLSNVEQDFSTGGQYYGIVETPEPSSVLLSLVGLAALGEMVRRKKKAPHRSLSKI